MLNLSNLRTEYRFKSLDVGDLNLDPFLQFKQWLQEALYAQIAECNAMALATASAEGRPSCRMILLKGIDKGLIFYTSYNSSKAQDLSGNPYASATFYWRELERQVVISGQTEKLTQEESETYFKGRPRTSQLGAWASQQDQVLTSRKELEEAYRHYEDKYQTGLIPKPPTWGGYRLLPHHFEFWQGRPNRLHDRFRYLLVNNTWQIDRLAP
jgi:pyridoxamine 5'-phosphate oxidase